LIINFENVFGSIGECFDAALDEKKSKTDVAKGVFEIVKSLLKFGFDGTKCIVKHTPKAVVTVANAKRELTENIGSEYQKFQKEQKEQALEEKIKGVNYPIAKDDWASCFIMP